MKFPQKINFSTILKVFHIFLAKKKQNFNKNKFKRDPMQKERIAL